ncbi:hypothetical protein CcCBS67573_g07117 [Chytriomyces confervae]|uniref:Uncharacterized protein n=1 Tax=Chytriomyces confervae TaxID=246404 RepID=A0A507EX55_9FUNG|nr:hypothetical protein CcCBS67573_g07117 [Chytriomyces confervae]
MLSRSRSCTTRLRAKRETCRHLFSTRASLRKFDANREMTNVVVTSDALAQNKFRFLGRDQASNAQVAMAINHTDTAAATPMSLLLIALGGCMAMNVQLLLSNKKLPVSSIRTEIRAQKRKASIAALKDTEPWESIHVHLIIESEDVDEMHRKESTVRELVAASVEKYCGVHKTLHAEISWEYSVQSAVVKNQVHFAEFKQHFHLMAQEDTHSSYLLLLESVDGAIYSIYIAIFGVGFVLNGWITAAAIYHRQQLLKTRIDHQILFILITCLVWSTGSITHGILHNLGQESVMRNNAHATCSSISVGLLVCANPFLAVERFCMIYQKPSQFSTSFIITDGMMPQSREFQKIWAWDIAFAFVFANTLIFWLYTSTYLYSTEVLRSNASFLEAVKRSNSINSSNPTINNNSDHLCIETECKLLTNSLIISCMLSVCYVPIMVFVIATVFTNIRKEDSLFLRYVGQFFAAIDVVCTLLYFSRNF